MNNLDNLYKNLDILSQVQQGQKLEIENLGKGNLGNFTISYHTGGTMVRNTERFLSRMTGYYHTDRQLVVKKLENLEVDLVYELEKIKKMPEEEQLEALDKLAKYLDPAIVGLRNLQITYTQGYRNSSEDFNPHISILEEFSQNIENLLRPLKIKTSEARSEIFEPLENLSIQEDYNPIADQIEKIRSYLKDFLTKKSISTLEKSKIDKRIDDALDFAKVTLLSGFKKESSADPQELIHYTKYGREQKLKKKDLVKNLSQEDLNEYYDGNPPMSDVAKVMTSSIPVYSDKRVPEHILKKGERLNFKIAANPNATYLLVKVPLGKGSFKNVSISVEAHDYPRLVAHSIIKYSNPINTNRLSKEIEIHKPLNHPSIVRLFHICSYYSKKRGSTTVSLMTEYCNKGTLTEQSAELASKSPEERQKLIGQIMKGVLDGFLYLEENGINHRDIKTDNILLHQNEDGDLQAKIADFGFAEKMEKQKHHSKPEMLGSPIYMAPELIHAYFSSGLLTKEYIVKLATNKRDIWALGATLYYLRTQKELLLSMEPLKTRPKVFEFLSNLKQDKIDTALDKIKDQDSAFHEFNKALLTVDCDKRPTVQECLALLEDSLK